MRATNERLAKLEQMYEELTILEQKAALQPATESQKPQNSSKNAALKKSTGKRTAGSRSGRGSK